MTHVKVRVEGFLKQPQYDTSRGMLCSLVFALRTAFGMASVCKQCSANPDEDIRFLGVSFGPTGSMVGVTPMT